ncbi:MAG: hypothetical protein LBD84_07090 [Campylobacteraceae bacterium]|jgi:hypothetical protein|nr:hypothetical protein [Campylobacteraceae bacterium]
MAEINFSAELIPNDKSRYAPTRIYLLNPPNINNLDLKTKDIGFDNSGTRLNAENIQTAIEEINDIAERTRLAIMFDAEANMNLWLADNYKQTHGLFSSNLKIGKNIYIAKLDKSNYWRDKMRIWELEIKTDLLGLLEKTLEDKPTESKTSNADFAASGNVCQAVFDGLILRIAKNSGNNSAFAIASNSSTPNIYHEGITVYDTAGATFGHLERNIAANSSFQNITTNIGYTQETITKLFICDKSNNQGYNTETHLSSMNNAGNNNAYFIKAKRINE